MIKNLLKVSAILLFISSTIGLKRTQAQYSIVTTAQQHYNFDATKVTIAPNITISPSDATSITDAKVSIGYGFQAGDILSYSGTLPTNVTQSYDSNIGTLTFTGTLSSNQWIAILKQVQFSNASASTVTKDRKITFTLNNTVMGSNNHFYKFVTGTGNENFISWSDANNTSNNKKFNGLQGYLATITSQSENDLITSELKGNGWLGASDDCIYLNKNLGTTYTGYGNAYNNNGVTNPSVGNFYWVTGPEKGTQFYKRLSSYNNGWFSAINGIYSNFESGEPNDGNSSSNTSGEYYLEIYSKSESGGYGTPGKWNDWDANTANSAYIGGYVVEFGGMSGDPTTDFYALGTVTITNTITTPVTFKSFVGAKVNTTIQLTWTTASEINSKSFEIQRSADGNNWQTLGTTSAAGNSNILMNYNYTDYSPLNNINYYRIKEIDLDGKFMYSSIISLNYNEISDNDVKIYPNPVNRGNTITIQMNSTSNDQVTVKLIDMSGRNIASKISNVTFGQNNITLPINYPSGMYIIEINNNNGTKLISKKIIVR